MFGQYKRIRGLYEGVLTGKGLSYGGSLARDRGDRIRPSVPDRGDAEDERQGYRGQRPSLYPAPAMWPSTRPQKAQQMGAKVVTMSDSTGWVYDAEGIDLAAVKEIKEVNRGRLSEYKKYPPERRVP